jgi:Ala-tRNA(Pro) deacylase
MLGTIVDYLHGARVPFRLASYPTEEPLPRAAHPLPAHAVVVDTEIILVEGRVALACFPAGEAIDYTALSAVLGAIAVPADYADLPGELASAAPPIPPFGQLFGLPIIVDEGVEAAAILSIPAFGGNDFFDIAYDDWARVEAPRVASFASAGELPVSTEPAGDVHPHH